MDSRNIQDVSSYKNKVIYDDFNITKSAAKRMIRLEWIGLEWANKAQEHGIEPAFFLFRKPPAPRGRIGRVMGPIRS